MTKFEAVVYMVISLEAPTMMGIEDMVYKKLNSVSWFRLKEFEIFHLDEDLDV